MNKLETKFGIVFVKFENDYLSFYDEIGKYLSSVDKDSFCQVNGLENTVNGLSIENITNVLNKSGDFRDFLFGIGFNEEEYDLTFFSDAKEMYFYIYDIDIVCDYKQIEIIERLFEMIDDETLENNVLSWDYARKIGEHFFSVGW